MAGAPIGNQNAAKAKQWRAAIERALDARGAGDRLAALETLAEKLLISCESGDLGALKELGDRIDGKPAQVILGDEENPIHLISRIERAIVRSDNKDR